MGYPRLGLAILLLGILGCTASRTLPGPPRPQDPDALRARATQLWVMAQQLEQEAAVFRHQFPTGQPIMQRKAVAADLLRDRAFQLQAEARRLEAIRPPTFDRHDEPTDDPFDHHQLARELRELAAEEREEASMLARDDQANQDVVSDKRRRADRLDALAREVERPTGTHGR